MVESVYSSIYNILVNTIFGGSLEGVTYGAFFCEGIATICCAILVALPFIIVWRIVRRFI